MAFFRLSGKPEGGRPFWKSRWSRPIGFLSELRAQRLIGWPAVWIQTSDSWFQWNETANVGTSQKTKESLRHLRSEKKLPEGELFLLPIHSFTLLLNPLLGLFKSEPVPLNPRRRSFLLSSRAASSCVKSWADKKQRKKKKNPSRL